MRICIFGAGSLGSAVGGILSCAHDVLLVGRRPHMSAIREHGLVMSGSVRRRVWVETSESVAGLPAPDLVILTTKAYDTDAAIRACRVWSSRPTRALTLQNGLGNLEKLRQWKHADAFGGTTTLGATMLSPGKVRVSGLGTTTVGGDTDPKGAAEVADAMSLCGLRCEVVENVEEAMWSKAVVSACINPLTAILRVRNGALLKSHVIMRFVDELCDECVAVSRSRGMKLTSRGLASRVRAVALDTARNRSSMLQDIERRKRTEIDYINGAFADTGAEANLPVPLNRTLTAIIRSLERSPEGKG